MTSYKVAMIITDSFHNDIEGKDYKYGSPTMIDDKSKPIILYYFLDDYERVWDEGKPISYDNEELKNNASVSEIDYTDKVLLINLFNYESLEDTLLKFEVGKETSVPDVVDENDHAKEYKFTPTKIAVANGIKKDTAVFNEIVSSVWEGYYSKQQEGGKLPKVAENVQNAESYKKCAECSDSVFGLEEEICFECSSFGAEYEKTDDERILGIENGNGKRVGTVSIEDVSDNKDKVYIFIDGYNEEDELGWHPTIWHGVMPESPFMAEGRPHCMPCAERLITRYEGVESCSGCGELKCKKCFGDNEYCTRCYSAETFSKDKLEYGKIYCSNCKKESPDYHYSCINCGSLNTDAGDSEQSHMMQGYWIDGDNFPELYDAETEVFNASMYKCPDCSFTGYQEEFLESYNAETFGAERHRIHSDLIITKQQQNRNSVGSSVYIETKCPTCGAKGEGSQSMKNAETFAVDVIHRKDGIEVGDNSMANEYQCGECDSVYDDSSDATICCKCPSCDEPIHEGDCIKYAESFEANAKTGNKVYVITRRCEDYSEYRELDVAGFGSLTEARKKFNLLFKEAKEQDYNEYRIADAKDYMRWGDYWGLMSFNDGGMIYELREVIIGDKGDFYFDADYTKGYTDTTQKIQYEDKYGQPKESIVQGLSGYAGNCPSCSKRINFPIDNSGLYCYDCQVYLRTAKGTGNDKTLQYDAEGEIK